jgi:6-phosphogluconolactonase
MNKTQIFDNKQDLANYFGELIYERSRAKDTLSIALSGGSTPKAIFDVLAMNFQDKIDWNKIHLYWGDERCVPPTHDESNYKMTVDHLINKVTIPKENIHRVYGEKPIQEATSLYIQQLKKTLPLVNGLPQFDIVILGMGSDGHTASIFPYQIELWNNEDICVPAQHPESGQARVSLSGKIINHAIETFFLVTGKDKAPKLDEILNRKGNFKSYPASLVKNPVWLLDKEAAGA